MSEFPGVDLLRKRNILSADKLLKARDMLHRIAGQERGISAVNLNFGGSDRYFIDFVALNVTA